MSSTPVIAIFDVGKTNKKLLLFDEHYKVVHEEQRHLQEKKDEDGFSCEDIYALTRWIKDSFDRLLKDDRYDIKAVNFSGYGASFVYLDVQLNVLLPLYNYLKPYSEKLKEKFYNTYGGESYFSKQTASPVLGNLNSGMQVYRLKYEKPAAFAKIKYALHLPQYLSFILSGKLSSDITSIGCHTNLWDFQNNQYHTWVKKEGIDIKLPAVMNCDEIAGYIIETIPAGIGLHDSSAALIPYSISFNEPFILLSTGTWCISLNPFNNSELSEAELQQDCLSYLSYKGKPVKASRLFAGYEHELQTKKLSEHFNKPLDFYRGMHFDFKIIDKIKSEENFSDGELKEPMVQQCAFNAGSLSRFENYQAAYHQLITDIITRQIQSTNLVLRGTDVKRIFVDGGFSNNSIYMNLLAEAFPNIEVYAASVPQASALGAALVMHKHWNENDLPSDIIDLKLYSPGRNTAL